MRKIVCFLGESVDILGRFINILMSEELERLRIEEKNHRVRNELLSKDLIRHCPLYCMSASAARQPSVDQGYDSPCSDAVAHSHSVRTSAIVAARVRIAVTQTAIATACAPILSP